MDGTGSNSPFALALAQRILEPDVDLNLCLRRVRRDVLEMTENRQEIGIGGTQSAREFYFNAPSLSRPIEATLAFSNQPRIALVIGNDDYNQDGDYDDDRDSVPVVVDGFANDLPNTVNDASDIAASLQRLHFDVTLVRNGDRRELIDTIVNFSKKLKAAGPDAIVVIFYASHAIQVQGVNFIIPVGAKAPSRDLSDLTDDEAELVFRDYALPISDLIDRLRPPSAKGVNVIILDSCGGTPGNGGRDRLAATPHAVWRIPRTP